MALPVVGLRQPYRAAAPLTTGSCLPRGWVGLCPLFAVRRELIGAVRCLLALQYAAGASLRAEGGTGKGCFERLGGLRIQKNTV